MFDDYMLNKALEKIKETISFEKFDDAKIFINTDNKLPHYITLKNIVILMICVIKDDGKFIHKYFQKNHCMFTKCVKDKQIDFLLMNSNIKLFALFQSD